MQSANIECWRHKLVGRSEDMFPQESSITVSRDCYMYLPVYTHHNRERSGGGGGGEGINFLPLKKGAY